ncbi:MAG: gluconate 2-dehydrogenase subunit 3 family protein [Rhodanobacteraceae bacterium]|nr:MAG: gluconate 2-dehydrogenase subunit 3 family protein [Rhodanobacteraceae bacterium]
MSSRPPSQSRRDFLRRSLVTVPALGLFGGAAIAPGHAAEASTQPYAPRYFNADEWAFVQAAVDRLIPADDTGPGALELGVAEFIDREMDGPYGRGELWYMQGPFAPDAPATLGYQLRFTPRELYRTGIKATDAWCRQQQNKDFSALAPEARDQVLKQLEQGAASLDGVPAKAFFGQLLQNTKEGYFADPMYGGNRGMGSWKMIGFPGARADYADWIEQPGKVYPLGPVSIRGDKA